MVNLDREIHLVAAEPGYRALQFMDKVVNEIPVVAWKVSIDPADDYERENDNVFIEAVCLIYFDATYIMDPEGMVFELNGTMIWRDYQQAVADVRQLLTPGSDPV